MSAENKNPEDIINLTGHDRPKFTLQDIAEGIQAVGAESDDPYAGLRAEFLAKEDTSRNSRRPHPVEGTYNAAAIHTYAKTGDAVLRAIEDMEIPEVSIDDLPKVDPGDLVERGGNLGTALSPEGAQITFADPMSGAVPEGNDLENRMPHYEKILRQNPPSAS